MIKVAMGKKGGTSCKLPDLEKKKKQREAIDRSIDRSGWIGFAEIPCARRHAREEGGGLIAGKRECKL